MFMRSFVVLIIVSFLCSLSSNAEASLSESYKKKMQEVVALSHVKNTAEGYILSRESMTAPIILNKLMAGSPDRPAMTKEQAIQYIKNRNDNFNKKVFASLPAIEENIALSYVKNFSEAELDQIIAFYKSPVGQKLARVAPEMKKDAVKQIEVTAKEVSMELVAQEKANAAAAKKRK